MAAGTLNLTIEQGATFDTTLTYRDAASALVNLTGYTARMDIRPTVSSGTIILTLNTTNSRITLGGAAGTIRLLIDASDTAAMTATTTPLYVYDLELISGSGVVTRLVSGTVTVSAEVTRST